MRLWDRYIGKDDSTVTEKEPTTDYTPVDSPTTPTVTTTPAATNGHAERKVSEYTIKPPIIIEDDLKHSIANYVRSSLDTQQKQRILAFTESVLAEILEAEISEVIGPRFEPLYEGVIAEVVQKFLLKALAQRAQLTLAQLTKEP